MSIIQAIPLYNDVKSNNNNMKTIKKLFCICLGAAISLPILGQTPQEEGFIMVHRTDSGLSDMNKAEKFITLSSFIPQRKGTWGPQPQGIVDENSPWLHVIVPLYDDRDRNSIRKAKRARLMYKRMFYFELSQDSTFQKTVYKSGPKRWSFYNPYRHLEKGKWYWRYGVADPDTPDKPVWVKEIYCFEITGKEYKVPVPPTPDEFVNAVVSRPAPTYTLLHEEFGHMLPTKTWPEMAKYANTWYEKQYKNNMPMSFNISDQTAIDAGYVKNGKITAKKLFFTQKIRARTGGMGRYISNLLAGYILTGDKKYRDRAVQKNREAAKFCKNAAFYVKCINDTLRIKANFTMDKFIDICPEVLTKAEIDSIVKKAYPGTWTPPQDFESAEHSIYDQHLWQEIAGKFKRPMMYARYHDEAKEELKYVYELWLFRAPSLGKNDGGSLEGDGYLGVHDNYLGAIPWMLYKLTGYNNFKASRWFGNLGKYLTYINPSGKAGSGFCDGDGSGATLPYTMETMAHLVPDNYWNLWRLKSIPRREVKYFASDLGKGDKAYTLLSLWNHLETPDVSNIQPPKEQAAVFRDIGEVGMHTNIGDTENNLQVTLHSSPYGSLMHTHPCQNAFNLAYGGQDLFWKTGFYNGGGWHNLLSYKCSRAHNTIMADGQVQGFHRTAYGWVPRFAHGDKISYAVGDASKAYNGKNRYQEGKRVNPIMFDYNYGFGKPGVTKFRRHIAMLRPNHVLIYDELEAEKPITWEFRLHSRRWMTQLGEKWLMGVNDHAAASARMFCKDPIKTSLRHKYMPNAEDGIEPTKDLSPEDMWLLRPSDEEDKLPNPIPEHYHGAFTTVGKHAKTRFLTLIEIHPGKGKNFVPKEKPSASGDDLTTIQAGEYTIKVQLDGNKPAFLEVKNKDNTAALVTGTAAKSLTLGNETKTAKLEGSTLLMEKGTYKGDIFIETCDSIPDMLRYGNKY